MEPLVVDLGAFVCGGTRLGEAPKPASSLAALLGGKDTCALPKQGWELGLAGGVLDYAVVSFPLFDGMLVRNGASLALSSRTTPAEVEAWFGEPYWRDAMDEELILFFEFNRGAIELQFEFPDRRSLAVVSLMRNGVLSDAEQRRRYGVAKSWPPA